MPLGYFLTLSMFPPCTDSVDAYRPLASKVTPRPLFCDVHYGQVQYFQQGIIGRKNRLGFGHFPQMSVEIFDGIDGVNQRPDLQRILEIGGEIRPVDSPGLGDLGILEAPLFLKLVKFVQDGRLVHSAINPLQIGHQVLGVLVADKPGRIAYLVDDALLYLCLRVDGLYGVHKSGQPIHTGDENMITLQALFSVC